MKWIFTGMVVLAFVFGALTGRMQEVSTAALSGAAQGVKLTLTLGGAICFWSGVMKIAQKEGLTKRMARIFSPFLRLVFRRIPKDDPALESVSMNISANLLGLGNAATPLGIQAMKEFKEKNPRSSAATHNMILFVVMNTSSLQIIPTTVAAIRLSMGSGNPMEILPPMLCTSALSLVVVIVAAKCLAKVYRDESC